MYIYLDIGEGGFSAIICQDSIRETVDSISKTNGGKKMPVSFLSGCLSETNTNESGVELWAKLVDSLIFRLRWYITWVGATFIIPDEGVVKCLTNKWVHPRLVYLLQRAEMYRVTYQYGENAWAFG